MEYPSRSIQAAVEALSRLPTVGKKTALRLALHLLKVPDDDVRQLADALLRLKTDTRHCTVCNSITETDVCGICSKPERNTGVVCVVEDTRDVIAIEKTQAYKGRYHVLGGLISPLDGIGPSQLRLEPLLARVAAGEVQEIILALNARMEGETTAFYLSKRLEASGVRISTLARGVPMGGELEFTDELTLGRSLQARVPYHTPLSGSDAATPPPPVQPIAQTTFP